MIKKLINKILWFLNYRQHSTIRQQTGDEFKWCNCYCHVEFKEWDDEL